MIVFYNDDYVLGAEDFDTNRKSQAIANGLPESFDIQSPEDLYDETESLIRNIHDEDYVNAVRDGHPENLARSNGLLWDPTVYQMALAHNAGCLAAAKTAAYQGGSVATLSSGLHHSRKEMGSGFCTFNGIALAAHWLQLQGLTTCIIDLDAHCGGGTYSMINHDTTYQLDCSVSAFDRYVTVDDLDIQKMSSADHYIENIVDMLHDAEFDQIDADIFIYNAGVDPINCGVTAGQLAARESMMADFFARQGKPVIVTMAGGYTWDANTMDDIRDLHIDTLSQMSGVKTNPALSLASVK